jgi:hypothetical protein
MNELHGGFRDEREGSSLSARRLPKQAQLLPICSVTAGVCLICYRPVSAFLYLLRCTEMRHTSIIQCPL